MVITSITPQKLVDWFHTRQHSRKILCVMLTPAREDQRKIEELVINHCEADTVLGDEVAFLLMHPGAITPLGLNNGPGEFAILQGTAFPLRETELFHDMSNEGERRRQEIAEKSARSMAMFAYDFMQLFAVQQSDIPALCVLVKGLDESVTFPLGRDWTNCSLLALLGRLRKIADQCPNFRTELQSLASDMPTKLKSASIMNRKIESETAGIVESFEDLLHRYHGNESDRTFITDFIARGCPSNEQLQGILDRLSISANDSFLEDGKTKEIKARMTTIETIRMEFQRDIRYRRDILSIADRAEQLVKNRNQLLHAIQILQKSHVTTTSRLASESLGRMRSVLESINLTGDLGEKILAATEGFRKLF